MFRYNQYNNDSNNLYNINKSMATNLSNNNLYCISLYYFNNDFNTLCSVPGTGALFMSVSASGYPPCASPQRVCSLSFGVCQTTPPPIPFPYKIKKALGIVVKALNEKTDQWIIVKKEILKMLPPHLRSLFGLRHPVTKKQILNEMDLIVIDFWLHQTGKQLKVDIHNEKTYTYRGRGFGLKQWHKMKKTQKEKTT